jgi:uncharacterized protein CbrC (UPF0167 family)
MVKISLKKSDIYVNCHKCNSARAISTTGVFNEIDAVMRLCPKCFGDVLVTKIRQYQRDEGNPDCFAKSDNYCDQRGCKFYGICLNMERRD